MKGLGEIRKGRDPKRGMVTGSALNSQVDPLPDGKDAPETAPR